MAISSPDMMLVPTQHQRDSCLQIEARYQGRYHQSYHCQSYDRYDTCSPRGDPTDRDISWRPQCVNVDEHNCKRGRWCVCHVVMVCTRRRRSSSDSMLLAHAPTHGTSRLRLTLNLRPRSVDELDSQTKKRDYEPEGWTLRQWMNSPLWSSSQSSDLHSHLSSNCDFRRFGDSRARIAHDE